MADRPPAADSAGRTGRRRRVGGGLLARPGGGRHLRLQLGGEARLGELGDDVVAPSRLGDAVGRARSLDEGGHVVAPADHAHEAVVDAGKLTGPVGPAGRPRGRRSQIGLVADVVEQVELERHRFAAVEQRRVDLDRTQADRLGRPILHHRRRVRSVVEEGGRLVVGSGGVGREQGLRQQGHASQQHPP
jgi:hypothetical protein